MPDEFLLRKDREPCRFQGKTARTKCSMNGWYDFIRNPCLTAKRTTLKQDNVVMVPITELDEQQDEVCFKELPLARKGAWEDIPASLDLHSLKVQKAFCGRGRRTELSYELPVIGHMMMSIDKPTLHSTPGRRAEWGGQIYDPSKLYVATSKGKVCDLKEFGPLYLETPQFSDAATKQFHCRTSDISRRQISAQISHRLPNARYEDRQRSVEDLDGVIIDLFRPSHVTHIGIAADSPQVTIFATSGGRSRRGGRSAGWQRYRGRLHVVSDPSALSLVTQFDLHYRCITTGRWILHGRYTGTSCPTAEHVAELKPRSGGGDGGGDGGSAGIRARYLKVVPAEWRRGTAGQRGGFRVAAYGVDPNEARRRQEGATETVRYTVVPAGLPRAARWSPDGVIYSSEGPYSDPFAYSRGRRWLRPAGAARALIREGLPGGRVWADGESDSDEDQEEDDSEDPDEAESGAGSDWEALSSDYSGASDGSWWWEAGPGGQGSRRPSTAGSEPVLVGPAGGGAATPGGSEGSAAGWDLLDDA